MFDISEKSDDLYLIHNGTVQNEPSEGLVLATLEQAEMFSERASIIGERERTARIVAMNNVIFDVIDSKTMQRKLSDLDPVLRALVGNLTIRLADANEMNEHQWQILNVYRSLSTEDIARP